MMGVTTNDSERSITNMAGGIKFSLNEFIEPDAIYWPGYFWLWNDVLDESVLIEQLRDMREHNARSVCVLPMPREFRPDSTNNQLDVSYLSDEFFHRVKIAVKEAKRLGINYWLYDEGGWPSGEACGQVTRDHPELRASVMRLSQNGKWQVQKGGSVDRLNQEATKRFTKLTHDGYSDAVGEYFGGTILFAFTDEPGAGRVSSGQQIPWTDGLGDYFEKRFGYRMEEHLDSFARPLDKLTIEDMRVRADFFDCWSQRFVDAYFLPIQLWCRKHGILSAGHLGGEDETIGSVTYGYGHILRTLRAMDVPGVDVIWRQVFPGKPDNHHFPIYAASAAHQIGSPYAFTESFAVYGNGLTLEQMKWITDYQYIRGINLMVVACYPLSTRDHMMCGERPHFCPINPLWDYITPYHSYTARLGYTLSCGTPDIETAIYFPIRDMWACGARSEAVDGYEALVDGLLQKQRAFDLIDDDVIADTENSIAEGAFRIGPMAYRNIILPPCAWLKDSTAARLAEFVRSGGHLFCLRQLPGVNGQPQRYLEGTETHILDSVDAIIQEIPSLVRLETLSESSSRSIRVTARKLETGSIHFLFNEGESTFDGTAHFQGNQPLNELDMDTGDIKLLETSKTENGVALSLHIPSGGSRLLVSGDFDAEKLPVWKQVGTLDLTEGWYARSVRQFDVGEHDYEIKTVQNSWEPVSLGSWKEELSEDFSGDVAYRITVHIPEEWRKYSLKLNLGKVEYAARVRVNGADIGSVVWAPYQIALPAQSGSIELGIVVTNTLANVLTSARVREDWQSRRGPGWPGPYDARAADFEKDSRRGGLYGPVRLIAGYWVTR